MNRLSRLTIIAVHISIVILLSSCGIITFSSGKDKRVKSNQRSQSTAARAPQGGGADTAKRPKRQWQTGLVGTWEGRGCQRSGSCWTISVAITESTPGGVKGTIRYPSLDCAARLEFVRWEERTAVFRERYTKRGQCVANGWLWLTPKPGDKMAFKWAYPNGQVDAETSLDRKRSTPKPMGKLTHTSASVKGRPKGKQRVPVQVQKIEFNGKIVDAYRADLVPGNPGSEYVFYDGRNSLVVVSEKMKKLMEWSSGWKEEMIERVVGIETRNDGTTVVWVRFLADGGDEIYNYKSPCFVKHGKLHCDTANRIFPK